MSEQVDMVALRAAHQSEFYRLLAMGCGTKAAIIGSFGQKFYEENLLNIQITRLGEVILVDRSMPVWGDVVLPFVSPKGRVWVKTGELIAGDLIHDNNEQLMVPVDSPFLGESFSVYSFKPTFVSRQPHNVMECYQHNGIEKPRADLFCAFMGWGIDDAFVIPDEDDDGEHVRERIRKFWPNGDADFGEFTHSMCYGTWNRIEEPKQ